MNFKRYWSVFVAGVMAVLTGQAGAQAFDPAVGFQGRLEVNGTPASGTYEMIFEVFNTEEGGFFQAAAGSGGSPLLVEVEDGLFTAELDFQPAQLAYSGVERWLEISVREPGDTFYTTLAPRQRLTPAPYANRAGSAGAADVAGDIPEQWKAFSVVPGVGPVYSGGGRVGIGTDDPTAALHVTGDAGDFRNSVHISHAAGGPVWELSSYSQISGWGDVFGIAQRGFFPAIAATDDGRVGMGTIDPQHRLQVHGNLNVNTNGQNTGLIIGTPNISDGGGSAMLMSVVGSGSEIQAIGSAGNSYGRLYLNPDGGDVGIGSVAIGSWFCTVTDPGGNDVIFGVRKSDGGAAFRVYADGDLSGCGITCLSDERQKERIEPLNNALSDILSLRGVSFFWKPELNRNPGRQIGFVAQEVEKVLPELVRTDPEGIKSVDYVSLTAVLAEAVQEQQATIEAQGAEIERLRREVEVVSADREMLLRLAARVSRLEAGE